MTTSPTPLRSALATAHLMLSLVLLASISDAGASTLTYNIVNYPAYQADQYASGTDTMSGTIVTDGSMGSLSSIDIRGGTMTFTSPGKSYSGTFNNIGFNAGHPLLYATPTQLLMPTGYSFGIVYYNTAAKPEYFVGLSYTNDVPVSYPYFYYGEAQQLANGVTPYAAFSNHSNSAGLLLGSTATSNPWVIATVAPEPPIFTLLGSALLGLGFVYLRRRRTKA